MAPSSVAAAGPSGATAGSDAPAGPIPPGRPAPDFTLPAGVDRQLGLRDLRGRPAVLVFYPADWSPVCGDQLALYNEILPEFDRFGAKVVGISVDGVWCHAAYAENRHLDIPLLADFEPKGAIARSYGVYRPADGVCERALFVLDADGVVRWSYLSPIGVNPGADGILRALESLGQPQPATAAATGGPNRGA